MAWVGGVPTSRIYSQAAAWSMSPGTLTAEGARCEWIVRARPLVARGRLPLPGLRHGQAPNLSGCPGHPSASKWSNTQRRTGKSSRRGSHADTSPLGTDRDCRPPPGGGFGPNTCRAGAAGRCLTPSAALARRPVVVVRVGLASGPPDPCGCAQSADAAPPTLRRPRPWRHRPSCHGPEVASASRRGSTPDDLAHRRGIRSRNRLRERPGKRSVARVHEVAQSVQSHCRDPRRHDHDEDPGLSRGSD
jgi:hypothetical protein